MKTRAECPGRGSEGMGTAVLPWKSSGAAPEPLSTSAAH